MLRLEASRPLRRPPEPIADQAATHVAVFSAGMPTCVTWWQRRSRATGRRPSLSKVYTHRIRSYVGAYAAQLGRVDAIVFTAGVGENASIVREWSLAPTGA